MSKNGFVSRADKKARGKGMRSVLVDLDMYQPAPEHSVTTDTSYDLNTKVDRMQKVLDETPDEALHVDDFIDNRFHMEEQRGEYTDYARWMFNHWRLPADMRGDFDEFMSEHKLFCVYEGEKHRVTGCSRLGDVWLTLNFEQDCGYQKRVNVEDCRDWTPHCS